MEANNTMELRNSKSQTYRHSTDEQSTEQQEGNVANEPPYAIQVKLKVEMLLCREEMRPSSLACIRLQAAKVIETVLLSLE